MLHYSGVRVGLDNPIAINGKPIWILEVWFVSGQEIDSRLQEIYLVKGSNLMKWLRPQIALLNLCSEWNWLTRKYPKTKFHFKKPAYLLVSCRRAEKVDQRAVIKVEGRSLLKQPVASDNCIGMNDWTAQSAVLGTILQKTI